MPQPSSISSILFLLVLLTFLFPWVSLKCDVLETASVTGVDIVMGHLDQKIAEIAASDPSTDVPEAESYASDKQKLEFYARAIGGLALVGAAITLLRGYRVFRGNSGRQIRALLGFLGLVLLVLFKFETEALTTKLLPLAGVALVNWKIGFWLACVSFVIVIGYQFVLMKKYRR